MAVIIINLAVDEHWCGNFHSVLYVLFTLLQETVISKICKNAASIMPQLDVCLLTRSNKELPTSGEYGGIGINARSRTCTALCR